MVKNVDVLERRLPLIRLRADQFIDMVRTHRLMRAERDQVRQRGLTYPGGTIQNERHESISFDGPTKKLACTKDMPLSHELGQVTGTHPPSKRRKRGLDGQ